MRVARIGDSIDHGGTIITGSTDNTTDNLGVARMGDSVLCDRHGMQTIVSGSMTVITDNLPTARMGDVTSCGATIITGSDDRDVADNVDPNAIFFVQNGIVAIYQEKDTGSLDDDPDSDDGLAIFPPVPKGRAPSQNEINRSIENGSNPAAPPPPVQESDTTPPPPPPVTPPVGCEDITLPLDYGIMLSPNFSLNSVSKGTAISKRAIVAQHGLTEQDIVCNLKSVCVNILEPLAAHLGGRQVLLITSGFRPGTGTSQHERGMAVDVQFTDQWSANPISDDTLWARAQWVKDNLPYDQFILEYLGTKVWFHLSFNRTGTNRRQLLTALKSGVYKPGLNRI